MADQSSPFVSPFAQAREDLAEKVSVAGWKECFQEKIRWIRRCFQISLLVLSGFCFYYIYQVSAQWVTSGYKDEVTFVTNREWLPFSNVTVCLQVYMNQTFIRENVRVPSKIIEQYTNQTSQSVDEFFSQLALFLAPITRPRHFDVMSLHLFSKVLMNNPQLQDFTKFAHRAYPACENLFQKCWFDNLKIDCCSIIVQSIADDGICYSLKLNWDSDNAAPSQSTIQHKRPGPIGGLTLEMSMPLNDFPWLDDVADNGFEVFVDATPFGMVQSPVGAPNGAETFVKVKPAQRILSTNCAAYNHLSMSGSEFVYYDPEGNGCATRDVENVIYKYLGCFIPFYTYRPNATTVCTPLTTYMGTWGHAAQDHSPNSYFDSTPALNAMAETKMKEVELDVRSVASERTFCPKHCRRWTYESSSSFFYLEKDEANSGNQTIYSKIHVYYGDFDYYQYTQARKMTVYLFFCSLANVGFLYWGISIISIFDISFYLSRYLYVWWKTRKQRSQIHPVATESIQMIQVIPTVIVTEHDEDQASREIY